MLEEAPDPKEVAHFHFNQLRTLKLAKDNETVPKECINVIAAASKYGLLFIGISNGFKVLKLENILDLDEDKENKTIEENYYSKVVGTESPVMMSLSSDQKTLAVCICRNGSVDADMYDIAAFADPEETPVPFHTSSLSRNNSKLKDFLWNPVSEGMYAYCMSDGSLHVHELTGMKLTVIATVPNANATSACWSPKGKQLVVGKRDGSFSQYKPTLQEVKNIPPPTLGGNIIVANICWVSTAQFAVLYVQGGDSVSPFLFMISTPKNAPIVYTNFYDVCLGNSSNPDQRYFLHHESAWGILICASTDSIEITVLGDSPSWVPWEIRDDCRALLPSKYGAKHAVSMGVMYCAQRRIIISEIESYAPMPIIFYLTDNGLLVSYHMVNSAPGSLSLVRPSTPIDRENERKRPGANQNISQPMATPNVSITPISPPAATFHRDPSPGFQSPPVSFLPSPAIAPGAAPPAFGSFRQNSILQKNEPPMPAFGVPTSFQNMAPPPLKPAPSSSPGTAFVAPTGISPDAERFHKPSKGISVITPSPSIYKDNTSGLRQVAVAQRSIATTKVENEKEVQFAVADSNLKPIPTQASSIGSGDMNQKENIGNQDMYLTAILDEIQTFEKEMQDLKKSSELLTSIGSKDEMANLKSATLKFQEFQNEMTETMVSLNSDIHSLKNTLLESFVLVEEGNSKERRRNDHSFISMLKDRALDPITAKRMQTIEQHYLYLSTQLQEVSNKLDLDWFEYLEKKKENQKNTRHISSAEAIYKTVVNNQKIIHNLRNTIELLTKKAAEKKLERISKRRNKCQFIKRSDPEALSKLADAFLQAKISNSEEEKPQFQKKMSTNAQNVLKKYLESSSIVTVRPTVVYSPSQSRLLSNSLLYSGRIDSNKNQTVVEETEPSVANQAKEGPNIKANSVIKPVVISRPPALISSNSSEKFANERNMASISKPQVTSAFEFEKLRLQNQVPPLIEDRRVENQFTGVVNKPSPKFTVPTVGFIPPKPVSSLSQPVTIAEPETKVLEISFNQGGPEVQLGGSAFALDKNLTPEGVENTQGLQDAKPLTSNLKTVPTKLIAPPSEKFFTPFSIKASPVSALAETTSQNENNISESNSKTADSANNQINKPTFTKPAAAGFSFFAPPSTSSPAFPNLALTSSFFTTPAKKEDNNSGKSGPTILNVGSVGTKATSAVTVTSSISVPSGNSNQNVPGQLGSTINESTPLSQKSAFPIRSGEELSGGFKFTNTQSTIGTSSFFPTSKPSSFFSFSSNKTPVSKELSFFQPAFGSSSTPQSLSASSETNLPQNTAGTFMKTAVTATTVAVTTEVSTKMAETNTNKLSLAANSQVNTQPSETTPSSTDQSPINLSQKSPTDISAGNVPISVADAMTPDSSSMKLNLLAEVTSSVSDTVVSKPDLVTSEEVPKAVSEQVTISASTETTNSTASAPVTNVLTQPSLSSSTVAEPTPATEASSPQPVTTTIAPSSFGAVPTTTVASTVFTPTSIPASSTPVTTSLFATPTTTSASVFGQTSGSTPSFFGQTASTQSSFFGKDTQTPVFGQSTLAATTPFGSSLPTTSSSPFTQAAGTFFSQPPAFGSNTANTAENAGFGAQPAAPAFGKSSFGQTQGSFGLAKAVFGQQNTPQAPVFGQPASPASNTTPFGQSSGNSVFSQSSFFSGLGGKPSAENANKNVFAVGNLSKPTSESSVFGATAFGAKTGGSFSGGSFSGGGGSVAQSGFGAFQQTPPKAGGGFGAAPAFGAAPSFGSAPTFGSPPSFGAGSPLSSVFGSQQSAQSANFSSFASANSPTFGSLASQNTGGFGNSQPQQQQQPPAFGQQSSPFGGASVFGSAPAFGSQQSSFGSPSAAPGNSSAFTQWRN